MRHIQHLTRLPENFREFIAEVGFGLAELYGPLAAVHYQDTALAQFQTALRHPSTDFLGWFEGEDALGLLVTIQRGTVTQFSFLHVLRRGVGAGIERNLLAEAIRLHRAGGAEAILAECLAFGPLDTDGVYESAGFDTIERELMMADLTARALSCAASIESVPISEADHADAANVIAQAYQNHPGRRLHTEVRDFESARGFISGVADGNYGPTHTDYLRLIRRAGYCCGIIAGCEAAPEVGFVLQVAVSPAQQNQGLGGQLVRELAQTFAHAGCTRLALGVTSASPARRLYQRLGFSLLRPVTAHVWWRP